MSNALHWDDPEWKAAHIAKIRAGVARKQAEAAAKAEKAARREVIIVEQPVHPVDIRGRIVDEWIRNPIPLPRPLTWNDLPRDARKCAKRPGIPDNAPVHQIRCVECRLPMWTRDEKLEDLCETCEFVLIDRKHRDRLQHERGRGGQLVNPFSDTASSGPAVNSLRGGNTRLL